MSNGLHWTAQQWADWAAKRKARHEAEASFDKEATAIGSRQARTGATTSGQIPSISGVGGFGATTSEGNYGPHKSGAGKLYPLVQLCIAHGLPEPRPEYEWHPTRRYRADYALVNERILIEVDGGLWIQGGHSRGAARLHDMEKDREATMLGWRTLRYPPASESQIVLDLKRMMGR